MRTNICTTIDTVNTMEKYDAACKMILSQKVILAWILKDYVKEYTEISIQEIVDKCIERESGMEIENALPVIRGRLTEDSTLNEGKVQGDVRFMAYTPQGVGQIFDVEAQGVFHSKKSLLKRGAYYLGRMISSQKGTEFIKSNYKDLKKVFVIWVCLKPPRTWENSVVHYSFEERNKIGNLKLNPAEYDLMTQIVIGLGNPDSAEVTGALRLLNVLFTDKFSVSEKKRILEEEFDIPMSETMEKGVEEMCTFSEAVYGSGIECGIGKVNDLYKFLISARREDDLRKAIEDRDFLQTLLNEFEEVASCLVFQ
ncbi:MAG: hypothetical protein IJN41_03225 [Firmicutes bacterium]|nr:hypothetical protein [Bacillota bacterium]